MAGLIATPHQAELNAERVMKLWGFTDAVATTGGADGGIDVRSSKALAQVKRRSRAASRPEVQQLYGARGSDHEKQLFFFAASAYSKDAVKYADEVDVRLFLYNESGAVSPVNRRAKDFLKAGGFQDHVPALRLGDWLIWIALLVGGLLGVVLMVLTLTALSD